MAFSKKLVHHLVNIAAAGSALSLLAIFSKYYLVFDLISHFRIQYIVLLIPAFFLAIYARRTKPLLLICLTLAIHTYSVTMSVLPESMSIDVAENSDFIDIKVLNSNLLLVNTNYEAQLESIARVEPDIIAFQEYTQEWHDVLSARLSNYPHIVATTRQDSFGIALYSKYPIISGGIETIVEHSTPVANVEIDLGDKLVRVMAVHPPPPVSFRKYSMRNQLMQAIAEIAANQQNAVIVMGDFNATPWTSHFTDMLADGKLRHTRGGHGLYPSWPANPIPFGIPIDHVLVDSHIKVLHFSTESVKGTDHLNVWSQLNVY